MTGKTKDVIKVRTSQVKLALRERYSQPEWSVFFEVANTTGAANRYADAVAMNMFPSRGNEIHGFEIKVSRSDWLRELKNPMKAEGIFCMCDRWWVVAAEGVVKSDELPVTWGLIVVTAKAGPGGGDPVVSLRQSVAAPQLAPTSQVTRPFMAAILRRASTLDEHDLRAAVAREVAVIRKDYESRVEDEIAKRSAHYARTETKLREVREATGIDLLSWMPSDEVAGAIKLVLAADITATHSRINELRNRAARFVEDIDKALTDMTQSQ